MPQGCYLQLWECGRVAAGVIDDPLEHVKSVKLQHKPLVSEF